METDHTALRAFRRVPGRLYEAPQDTPSPDWVQVTTEEWTKPWRLVGHTDPAGCEGGPETGDRWWLAFPAGFAEERLIEVGDGPRALTALAWLADDGSAGLYVSQVDAGDFRNDPDVLIVRTAQQGGQHQVWSAP